MSGARPISLLLAVVGTIVVWATARGQPSAPGFELTGRIGGTTGAMVGDGDRAYLELGPWLRVLDLSAQPPAELARLAPPQYLVAARGTLLFVGRGNDLVAMDGADAAHPVEVGAVDVGGTIDHAASWGSDRFILSTSAGLAFVDVANPAAMVRLGGAPALSGVVAAQGQRGYVAVPGLPGTFYVLDLRQPSAAAVLGTMPITGMLTAHAAASLRVLAAGPGFVAAGSDAVGPQGTRGLRMIDVQDPAHPREIGSLVTAGPATGLALEGDRAYLAAGRLYAVDVSRPDNPRVALSATMSSQQGLALAGERVAVAGEGLRLVKKAGFEGDTEFVEPDMAKDAVVRGDTAIVLDFRSDLWTLDVRDRSAPRALARLPVKGYGNELALEGSTVYAVAEEGGLHIFDVGDPQVPRELATGYVLGSARHVAVRDRLAVVGDNRPSLRVFDVTDPTRPALRGDLMLSDGPSDVAFVGPATVAVAQEDDTLVFVDVRTRASPEVVATLATGGYVQRLLTWRNRLLAGGGSGGKGWVRMVDVASPGAPRFIGEARFDYSVSDLGLLEDRLLVSVEGHGLHFVDLSDNGTFSLRASLPDVTSLSPFVALGAEHVVTSRWRDGVFVYRVDAARLPTPPGGPTPGPGGATKTPVWTTTPTPRIPPSNGRTLFLPALARGG